MGSDVLLKLVALLPIQYLLGTAVDATALALDDAVVHIIEEESWIFHFADFDSGRYEILRPRTLNNCRV